MTSYNPVVKNAAGGAILYLGLPSMSVSGGMQAAPTLAAGDVKLSIDGGALANLTTLPTVTPAAGKLVKVTLSQAETNGDNLAIVFSDQTSPKEWSDTIVSLQTVARNFDALAYPATAGRSLLVDASGQVSVGGFAVGSLGSSVFAAGAINAAAIAADAITASAIAADAIGASELAASAVTEIQAGLSTLDQAAVRAAVGLAAANLDTQLAAILAKILDAPATRAALGMAAANLDAQLATIAGYIDTEVGTIIANTNTIIAKTNNLPAAPAAVSDIPTANANADALLDRAAGVETGLTVRQFARLVAAVLLGKASGLDTATAVFRDVGDTKNRITATVDASGNRTAVARDAS